MVIFFTLLLILLEVLLAYFLIIKMIKIRKVVVEYNKLILLKRKVIIFSMQLFRMKLYELNQKMKKVLKPDEGFAKMWITLASRLVFMLVF